MTRAVLEDGRWFDWDEADEFKEATWWNGSNRVSKATNSQWNHETLYRTPGGIWVLSRWSQYEGVATTYDEIPPEEAARWLVRNEFDGDVAGDPRVAEAFAALQVK